MPEKKLSRREILAFSLPSFITSVMHGQTTSALPSIYILYFALDQTAVGTALIIVRALDAITDPLVGYLSDHTNTRFGRRKPWILIGGVLAIPALVQFFIPNQSVDIYYFTFWYAMLYLAWTIIEIPTLAWQAELSHDYRTRTKIASYRTTFNMIGGACFFMVPLLPFFPTSEFTPQTLIVIGFAAVILLPTTLLIAISTTPQGESITTQPSKNSLVDMLLAVRSNKPALLYLSANILLNLGNGMSLSVFFIYISAYLQLGDKIAFLWLIPTFAMLLFIPVWAHLCSNYNRHRVWSTSSFIGSTLMLGVLFIEPGAQSFIPYLILFTIFQMNSAAGWIAAPSMLGDIIDFDTLKTRVNKSGQYNALLTLTQKCFIGIGGALGFYSLSLFGFDPTAQTHDAMAAFGIKATMSIFPASLFVAAAIIIWFFPINMKRQAIIRKQLRKRTKTENLFDS